MPIVFGTGHISQLSLNRFELPARVTAIRLSGSEVETALVEIDALLAAEAPVAILVPRR